MEEYRYTITKEEINECELSYFTGEIQTIEDITSADQAIRELQKESVLGFDTESKPSFRKGEHHPISLVQLSSMDKAYLFRIKHIKKMPDFSPVLSNEKICKIGLGIKDELVDLEKKLSLKCQGFIDLEQVAAFHKFHQRGVRALATFFLGARISKSAQKSNWERSILTEQQKRYAATDAWVCLKIYVSMLEKGFIPLENEEEAFVFTGKQSNEQKY